MTTTDDTVKTRKKHECRVCGEIIPAGEAVIRRAGFDSDGPWAIHMHPECERLTKDWDSMDWESIGPGEVKRPNRYSTAVCGLARWSGWWTWRQIIGRFWPVQQYFLSSTHDDRHYD
ncbi:MAG: hypothetical protein EB141_17700 [Verrucomicrobia bacterium]|nr:hypothetical protein [Verrucomicrobiota bacterium]